MLFADWWTSKYEVEPELASLFTRLNDASKENVECEFSTSSIQNNPIFQHYDIFFTTIYWIKRNDVYIFCLHT